MPTLNEILDALDQPKHAPARRAAPTTAPGGRDAAYGAAALAGEIAALVGVPIGQGRNDQLNTAAFRLGQLVPAGALDADTITDALGNADGGLHYKATANTIKSGLTNGMQHPRAIPDRATPRAAPVNDTRATPATTPPPGGRHARITWADTITPRAVRWAWLDGEHGRIPAGTLTIAAGREGTGKSSYGIWLVARVTTGTLPGIWFGQARRCLYLATEDSWAHTLVPRMIAAGADLTLVGRLDILSQGEDVTLSLPDDLAALEAAIAGDNVALVILDPLMSLMSERINANHSREVRIALDPLVKIADRTGAVLLGIAHFNKSSSTDAASLITGSGAFKDVPRALFGFARDGDIRVMTQVKNSLGRDDLPSLNYAMVSTDVPIPGELDTNVARFTFTGESSVTVTDMLRDTRTDEDMDDRDHVADWLRTYLIDSGGEATATDIRKASTVNGFAWRTVQRARTRAGAQSVRRDFPARVLWSIDPNDALPRHSRATAA